MRRRRLNTEYLSTTSHPNSNVTDSAQRMVTSCRDHACDGAGNTGACGVQRAAVLAWFWSLEPCARVRVLTVEDQSWILTVKAMLVNLSVRTHNQFCV